MAVQLAEDLARNGSYGIGSVDTFLRLDAVKHATGLGRSTIYDLMSQEPPAFPRPVKIGYGKAVAWPASEVAQWQRDRMAARDKAVT
ncbi:AlpA family transcriptional regulator [Bradyrhizobium sp. 26S5]|uniref:helix-turn-helix transcriptional regulator n=1 Tax=Bradyrhizobium sp. 26S5 TaxID=3139729 RepID=UPI0030CEA401